jgi:hypothetical protein
LKTVLDAAEGAFSSGEALFEWDGAFFAILVGAEEEILVILDGFSKFDYLIFLMIVFH